MSFNASYTVIAIDEFSKVAKEISQAAKEMKQCLDAVGVTTVTLNKDFKSMQSSIKQTVSQSSALKASLNLEQQATAAKQMEKAISQTAKTMTHSNKAMVDGKKSITEMGKEFSEFADKFATSAYYRFMNVGLPVMAFTIPALKELTQADDLNTVLKSSVSNFTTLDAQASSFAKTTKFSVNDLKAGQVELARMGVSGKDINTSMKGIVEYAAQSGQTIASATKEVASAALKGTQIGSSKAMARGGSSISRLLRDSAMLNAKFSGIAEKQAKTVSGEIIQSLGNMGTSFANLFDQIGPPIASALKQVSHLTEGVAHFLEKHKSFAKVIGFGVVALSVLMAGSIALGVTIGGLSMAFSLFAGVIGISTGAITTMAVASTALGAVIGVLTSPITLIIAGVTALTIGLGFAIHKLGGFKQIVLDIKNLIEGGFLTGIHQISEAFHKISSLPTKLFHSKPIQNNIQSQIAIMSANQQSKHQVSIEVEGRDVKSSSIASTGDTQAMQIMPLGTNYGGGL